MIYMIMSEIDGALPPSLRGIRRLADDEAISTKGVVKHLTVTMPVSFRSNILRHKNRNRKTIGDTGFVTFTIGRGHHECIPPIGGSRKYNQIKDLSIYGIGFE